MSLTNKFASIIAILFCSVSHAETFRVTPYLSLGAYHRDCAISDPILCNNEKAGSDTPGTIDLGFRIIPSWPRLISDIFPDEIDVGWHHQSYVDRGYIIPGLVDLGGDESQIDMYGIRCTWQFNSLSFSF